MMFTIKNGSNYHGGVCVKDITLVTRKMNACYKKRKTKRRSKKIKSRREEEATGENTNEIRSEEERRRYQEHRTLHRPCVRKKTKQPATQAEIQVSNLTKSRRINSFQIPSYPEHQTLYRPCVRKNFAKQRNQQHKQKFKSQI